MRWNRVSTTTESAAPAIRSYSRRNRTTSAIGSYSRENFTAAKSRWQPYRLQMMRSISPLFTILDFQKRNENENRKELKGPFYGFRCFSRIVTSLYPGCRRKSRFARLDIREPGTRQLQPEGLYSQKHESHRLSLTGPWPVEDNHSHRVFIARNKATLATGSHSQEQGNFSQRVFQEWGFNSKEENIGICFSIFSQMEI